MMFQTNLSGWGAGYSEEKARSKTRFDGLSLRRVEVRRGDEDDA